MKKYTKFAILLLIIVVVVAAAFVYFAIKNGNPSSGPEASPSPSTKVAVIDMRMVIDEPYAYIDGDRVFIDENNYKVTPLLYNERAILPIEFIGKVFDIPVEWNELEHSITIDYNGKHMVLYLNSNKTVIDGQEIILDVAPIRFENKTYLPLRFIGENLDFEVDWIESIKQVTLFRARGDTSADLAERKALIADKLNAIELSRAFAKLCATDRTFYESLLDFADYTKVEIDVIRPYMADYWRGTKFDVVNTGKAPWIVQVKKVNGKLHFLVTDSSEKPNKYFEGQWITIVNPFETAPSPSPSPSPSVEPSPSVLPSFHATPLPPSGASPSPSSR